MCVCEFQISWSAQYIIDASPTLSKSFPLFQHPVVSNCKCRRLNYVIIFKLKNKYVLKTCQLYQIHQGLVTIKYSKRGLALL